MNNQIANRKNQSKTSDIIIIVKNIPSEKTPKVVGKVVNNIKRIAPKVKMTIVSGSSDKMAKIHHDKTNAPRIGYKAQGEKK